MCQGYSPVVTNQTSTPSSLLQFPCYIFGIFWKTTSTMPLDFLQNHLTDDLKLQRLQVRWPSDCPHAETSARRVVHNWQVGALTSFVLNKPCRTCRWRNNTCCAVLRNLPSPHPHIQKPEFMCVTVCRQSDKVVCVSPVWGGRVLELGVGESGAHSSVDLVGIKVKRNVSAPSRLRPGRSVNRLGGG